MNATTSSEINPILTYVTWNDYTSSAQYLTSSQNPKTPKPQNPCSNRRFDEK
jgi:hypothetical protein